MDEPLSPPDARRLIRELLRTEGMAVTKHARAEMVKDDLTLVDVVNVLRGGVVEQGEFENGSWRYRVRTMRMGVVVSFRSDPQMVVVVTAWRIGS